MASIEQSLVALLLGESTITTKIGNRLTPDLIPQAATLPALAYQRVATDRDSTLVGTNNLTTPTIQLTIWSRSAVERSAIKQAIVNFVRRLNREWRSGERSRYVADVRFGAILVSSEVDDHEQDSNVYQAFVDLEIMANVG